MEHQIKAEISVLKFPPILQNTSLTQRVSDVATPDKKSMGGFTNFSGNYGKASPSSPIKGIASKTCNYIFLRE